MSVAPQNDSWERRYAVGEKDQLETPVHQPADGAPIDPAQVPLPPEEPRATSGKKRYKKYKSKNKNKNKNAETSRSFHARLAGLRLEPEYEKHWFYQSQGRMISIVSEDGVEFKADSDRLRKASTLFANMLNEPQLHDSSPLPIPFPAEVIQTFLDLINVSSPSSLLKTLIDVDIVQDLFRFTDYAGCDDLHFEVRRRLLKLSKNHPRKNALWLLQFGSDVNDVGLAKIALKRLAKQSSFSFASENLFDGFRNLVERLQPSFQAEILSLVLTKTAGDAREFAVRGLIDWDTRNNEHDWEWVGRSFNPERRTEVTDEEDVSTDEDMKKAGDHEAGNALLAADWTAEPINHEWCV
ncbi:uncharacterized protein I303_100796 [Kwoniella dejecticola CBS 10117]|uniref:BTB domain-containing protein n=1 Tax=Kwoniella dejecticola CBS 10117 TaxID=1296121 RepID=A0A1A6AG20_9TREE|nr:uncharacterized protein I303_00798 [Kwoniella dejecticola CBS 10117]OBR88978.1 hypothetical protein I303_00798 [Kwoniella dejecticola CBS 10117]